MIVLPHDLGLPDRDTVLGQAAPFDRARWIPELPDAAWWPTVLDSCPLVGKWPWVDRRTVFSIAPKADTVEGRRHLLVAALVWGTGTKTRSVDRRAQIFRHSPGTDIDARLDAALETLRERGATEAYWALNNDQHIPYLGAAFFTKVLYFAGHESPTGPYRPLILDSVVSQALKDLKTVDADWPENGWTTDQYRQYLEGVHDLAQRRGVLPDQVEAALFFHGKQLP
ncbi:8-oxoguanine DNA glycosylase OGG fold protein [Streptomyces mirabilis]|uniref:8-oxoguanine DNA glycosylase OGG fold protein n=1 Tax=Streptomyces mirabilis TaxID=68239 RepID=UPI0036637BFF